MVAICSSNVQNNGLHLVAKKIQILLDLIFS